MSEILHLTRDYEVSVWTLQDSFITVLGASSARYRGRIQNPEMKLVNDGTQEFTFSIPMYLDDGINRIKNPIWTDIYNASVIAGMRKIKVIFNKGTDVERVFEFVITKVTKSHENDKPQCDVQCEGLAFHELGKIGYKIEFSTDVLAEENYQWYIGDQTDEEPIPTIDYWNQKKLGLELYPDSGIIDATKWYYKVEMDWSSYANGAGERSPHKIYDEEYTIAWTNNLLPSNADSIVTYKEKSRVLDEKDSNIYNLTQKLAETFGVFCRYEYGYDNNYHIISRTVVYYNTGIKDRERKLSFTYPYSSTKIAREDDSVDIVTKMYVSAIEDQTSESGLISITNSDANPTHEDYLLNFDYLKDINTITQEQYDEIAIYERKIRQLNDSLVPLQNELLVKQDRLPRVEALMTIADNARQLDTERLNNSKRLENALTNEDGVIIREGMNAESVIMQVETPDETYFFNVKEKGVLANTIRVYKTMNSQGLQNEITDIGKPQYDEFGNLEKMTNIPFAALGNSASKIVYITYSYSPKLYYERIENVWAERLAKDEADYAEYQQEYEEVKERIDELNETLDDKRQEKQDLIKAFERMMGPALREGYWTPENYSVNTGEKYTDYMEIKLSNLVTDDTQYNIDNGDSGHTTFLWDTERFEDEQKSSYELGVQQNTIYYPCIKLTDDQFDYIQTNLNDTTHSNPIGILYYDYIASEQYPHDTRFYRSLVIGSSVQLAFIYESDVIQPVLLLTGITDFSDDELVHLQSAAAEARLGYLSTTTEVVNNKSITSVTPEPDISQNSYLTINTGENTSQWFTLTDSTPLVYLRCKVDSLSLKINETDLNLSYNGNLLNEFEDYYVFQRVDVIDENNSESNYYITIKPEIIFKYGYLDTHENPCKLVIRFVLSNASTAVYLDAREILKENSKPKVTYTVDPSVFYEDFIYTEYNALNTIAFINDYELEFEWVQGYISEINLNLDFPSEDTIEVKNYKNKFEDLFSTIVAQTEAMEKNEGIISSISKVITADGSIIGSALQGALNKVDLSYAFNNGKLVISEKDGIWGISDDGVVAFRGGGIFTSNEKDVNGNWIWNTGIVPQGINANLITAGQLDTNKVVVYAGDRMRFQLNGDGLFAFKSFLSDYITNSGNTTYNTMMNNRQSDTDYGQYVVMDSEGLFLKANRGAYILNDTATDYILLSQDITRVELSWQGLKMRNWDNQITFFASASTGDLFLSGTLNANKVYVQESDVDWNRAQRGNYSLAAWYLKMFEDHVKVSENLTNIFNKASEILTAARESQTAVNAINMTNYGILSTFFTDMSTKYIPVETTAASHPWNFKTGDIWNIPATGNTPATHWIAISNWDEVYNSESAAKASAALSSTAGWNKIYNGSLAQITGATMKVDAAAGSIYLGAGNNITIESGGTLDIGASSSLNLTSNGAINLNGSGLITLASTSGIKLLNSGKTVNIFNLDNNGITIGSGGKIKIESDLGIDIVSASNTSASVIQINRTTGILLGSSKKLSFSSSTSGTTGANVEIDPTRIIFGVSATGSTSFVEIRDTFIIAGIGDNKTSLENGNNPSSSLAGLKITNSGIWLATTSGNTTNLISMDHNGIKLGSVPASGNEGSFVSIAKEKILIGSTAQLYINAANVELNTTYNGTGAAFRLGSTSDPELLFADGTLKVKGEIIATTFRLSGNNYDGIKSTDISDFDTAVQNAATFSIDGLSYVTNWANTNKNYVSLTSSGGLLIGANNGIIIPSSANSASNPYLLINEDGIELNGKHIMINGKQEWSRDDIIIMDSDATAAYGTVAKIEQAMANATNDWVLIKPFYDAKIETSLGSATKRGPTRSFGFTGSFRSQQSFATISGMTYTYKINCEIATSASFQNNDANNNTSCFLYLSDVVINGDNYSSAAKVTVPINASRFFTLDPLTIEDDASSNINLYQENSIIYYYIRIAGAASDVDSCSITNLVITGLCPQTTKRVPCTVYYYPKVSS